ncbi:AP-3 complex subunit sigma-1-like [Choloepus didactylus]|uniref:AP-3 complex subunit sigma-1-like n=1 Tax=Choloepus didactylus TaxID=27675 RepID=UPI00189DDBF8|nr:AP-3 complex subunit sigma-1-like [Choloepus didactylus]
MCCFEHVDCDPADIHVATDSQGQTQERAGGEGSPTRSQGEAHLLALAPTQLAWASHDQSILIFNNHRKPRLSKFYQPYICVETFGKCFGNVCELDLIFHVEKVPNILADMLMGGLVLETKMNEIVTQIDAQNKLEKSEAGLARAPAQAISAVKNMNLPEIPRSITISNKSIKVPNMPSFT